MVCSQLVIEKKKYLVRRFDSNEIIQGGGTQVIVTQTCSENKHSQKYN